MVAFNPISPTAARQLVGSVETDDTNSILADFVEAGLIKAYARVVETLSVGSGRAEVRDGRIPRDLWRRILAEGKIADVWSTGTVRLHGDGMIGGRPAVIITGIRFDERAVRDAAGKHAAEPAAAVAAAPARTPKSVPATAVPVAETSASDASPLIEISPPVVSTCSAKRGLGPDELCVSVQEAMEIIGIGRTTLYKLEKTDDLILTKVGGRTMVDADSIRKLLARKL